jgi:hypothetical protein
VGSTLADVDRLLTSLACYLAEGPRAEYSLVGGRWQPVDDPRSVADPLALARAAGCGPAAG